jgi:RNA polymerase sigma-70 factor (ECF subfamily)
VGSIARFERGTNLNAWLFTILRNLFHSEYRKRKREVEDADGSYAARLRTHPDQHGRLDFEDFRAALATLPLD